MKYNKNMTRKKLLCSIFVAGLLQSCASTVSQDSVDELQNVDRESLDLIQQRIREESARLLDHQRTLNEELTNIQPRDPVPDADPEEETVLDTVMVTIDVQNEDVQNVLRALAEQAGMNLLLDPELANLNRRISMSLRDVPASTVFDRVMELLDLYGDVQGNVLVVRPFEETVFHLDFLADTSGMDFNMGGDVFGANSGMSGGTGGAGGGGGSGGSGGGESAMTGSISLTGIDGNSGTPYAQLDSMLQDLLGRQAGRGDANDRVPGINLDDDGRRGQNSLAANPMYSLNPMTGTLYVRARPSQVRTITTLIDRYKDVLQRQVLIEAQILDVSLNEQFSFGIDWSMLRGSIAAGYGSGGMTMDGVESALPNGSADARSITLPGLSTSNDNGLSALYSSMTFSSALSMLNNFGTVRVLSNPSVRAMNSRPAFISVGRNSRYISESTAVTNTVGGGDSITSTSISTSSVFNGIMLGVQPFISDDGHISLSIHPMQSEVQEESLQLIDVGGDSRVSLPIIDFKGLTTSLSLNSGDTIILGGLIDEMGGSSGDGIPGLRDLRGIGPLFGRVGQSSRVRELVIVLRVTVI